MKRAILFLALAAPWMASRAQSPSTIPHRGHAHNDYQHARPMVDALEHGFNSIEADVHLVHGQLLVAHHRDSVSTTRTLETLYLQPLRAYIGAHGGRVWQGAPPLQLLIDVKSDSEATYAALDTVLRRYADILTIFVGDTVIDGPVVAVISGNRAVATMRRARVRFAALDGRLPDLGDSLPMSRALMPLVSDSWAHVTTWRGAGPPPEELRRELSRVVRRAHQQGRQLRFWGSPDTPAVWQLLRDSGVDLINADDLEGLRDFLAPAGAAGSRSSFPRH